MRSPRRQAQAPRGRQVATAELIANDKGRSQQERDSLKKRLLRKWISK
jgi:hypothetical protein